MGMGKKYKVVIFVIMAFLISSFLLFNLNVVADSISNKNAQIIIKYKSESRTENLNIENLKMRKMLTSTIEVIEVQSSIQLDEVIASLENNIDIEYAQPNYILKTMAFDDEYYYRQWGIENKITNKMDINAEPAWEITRGSESVVIGILDTGIDISHDDLRGSIFTNANEIFGNNIDDDENGYIDDVNGYNFIDDNNIVFSGQNYDKHGTAVAGIIAAQANNIGIRGVADNVKILPLKFMSGNEGYTSDAILAIEYAKSLGVKIINCSFGSGEYNPALKDIMNKYSDILFVCAAGNNGKNTNENKIYPACYELSNIISVGAINQEGLLYNHSNYGAIIDVVSPGVDILTTIPQNQYALFNGTSMSTAYVTGIAALLKSNDDSMSANDMVDRIKNTVQKCEWLTSKINSGGILDAYAALINEQSSYELLSLDIDISSVQLLDTEEHQLYFSEPEISLYTMSEIEPIVAQGIHYGNNGVNPASGNFSYTIVDINIPSPGMDFIFSRTYNSLDQDRYKAFGRGWSSMIDSRITVVDSNKISVTMPNGATHRYSKKNGAYVSSTTRSTIDEDTVNYILVLTTKEQEKYIFYKYSSSAYKLIEIKDKTDSTVVEIVYYDGYHSVNYILDSVGRRYSVEYLHSCISSITDPFGRVTKYNYYSATDGWHILKDSIDIMGNVNRVLWYAAENNAEDDPNSDKFITHIYNGDNKLILSINYYIYSSEDNYGKVKSYVDAYNNLYTFDYKYMHTEIKCEQLGIYRTEYYDSYMYTYDVILGAGVTNEVTQRKYFRPNSNNYGEVIQEFSNVAHFKDVTTYIRDDVSGNVNKIVNPDGSTKQYWYDNNNNVIAQLDEDENCSLFVYENNLLIQKARYLYKGFPNDLIKENIETYIQQNIEDFIVENYRYADGSKFGCIYSKLLEEVEDAEGNLVKYTYDKYGNLLSQTLPYKVNEEVVAEAYEYYINYVNKQNIGQGILSQNYQVYIENYSDNFYTIGTKKQSTSPKGITVEEFYDNNNLKYKQTANNIDTVRIVYDNLGRELKEISASAYAKNNCISNEKISFVTRNGNNYYYVDFENASNTYNYATEYEYEKVIGPGYNEVIKKTYPMVDGVRDYISYNYLRNHTVSEQINPDGQKYTYSYDAINRLRFQNIICNPGGGNSTTVSLINNNFTQDDNGYYYEYSSIRSHYIFSSIYPNKYEGKKFDYRGNVIIHNIGESETKNIYNYNGTLSKTIDANGSINYFVYDTLNRVVEKWESMELYNNYTYFRYTKIDYYKNGQIKNEYICTQGVKISLDVYENVIPLNDVGRILYKKDGQIADEQDFIVKTYLYYSNGKLKEMNESNGSRLEYEYDDDGNLIQEIKNGFRIVYENNYLGKPDFKLEYVKLENLELKASDNYTIEGDYAKIKTEYQYENGNLIKVINPNNTEIIFGYDELNRLISTSTKGSFINKQGDLVNGESRVIKKLDWKNDIKEEITEEIANNTVNTILKTIYYPAVDKSVRIGYVYLLYEHKVETTDYSDDNNIKTFTTLYYRDVYGKNIISISPENYISDGVVSYNLLNTSNFSTYEKEMNRTEYRYDVIGRLISEIERYKDPNENNSWKMVETKRYNYDVRNNVTEEIDALENSIKYTYHLNNKLYMIRDAIAQENNYAFTNKYIYDALGRVLIETDCYRNDTVYFYDDLINSLIMTNIISMADGTLKEISTYSKYDENDNLLESYIDNSDAKITYIYNERNQPIKVIYPYDDTISANELDVKYDIVGNMTRREIQADSLEIYTYDEFNRNISKKVSNIDGSNEVTTYTSYDSRGNIRFEKDGNLNTIERQYNGLNQEIKNISIHPTTYDYDNNGNMIAQTDWLNNTIRFRYDPLNRLIERTDANENVIEKLFYNKNNAQIYSDTPYFDKTQNEYVFVRTVFDYDGNNRLKCTTDPELNETSLTYDRVGNIKTKTDGKGNTTTYYYDELNRLVSVENAKQEITEYSYDSNGNMLTQTAGDYTTIFEYNVMNKPVRKIDYGEGTDSDGNYVYDLAKTESYIYYSNGLMKEKTDRNGKVTKYFYDCHGRLTDQIVDNEVIHYEYDSNGNKTVVATGTGMLSADGSNVVVSDANNITTRRYDEINRVKEKTEVVSGNNLGTFEYVYDITTGVENGHVAEKSTDPKGNVTVKEYDKAGRLYTVKGSEIELQAIYDYYQNGAAKSVTYPDGSKAEYDYYRNNLLKTLENTVSGLEIDKYEYEFDAANNQIKKTEKVKGEDYGTTSYTYDELNRLETITEPLQLGGRFTEYTYDGKGNRETEEVTQNGMLVYMTIYYYNDQNRLTDTLTTKGDITEIVFYHYDNNGNLFSENKQIIKPTTEQEEATGIGVAGEETANEAEVSFYIYDGFNKLIAIQKGGSTITNEYNGEGLRVSKTVGEQTTMYLYEYQKPVLELDGNGNEVARNIYGTNLINRTVDVETLYYLYNGHADVTALLDSDGIIVAYYYYDAFGNPVPEETDDGDIDNPIRYSGYQWDSETGLYYLNARFYDATIARFLQEDTYWNTSNSIYGDNPQYIGNNPVPNQPAIMQSLNKYVYVVNNPIKYYDPTGYNSLFIDGVEYDIGDEVEIGGVKMNPIRSVTGAFGNNVEFKDGTASLYLLRTDGIDSENVLVSYTLKGKWFRDDSGYFWASGKGEVTGTSVGFNVYYNDNNIKGAKEHTTYVNVEDLVNNAKNKDGFGYTVEYKDGNWYMNSNPRGRVIYIPENVTGTVNGDAKILYPRDNWFAYQGNEAVMDANGNYIIVVGPKVLDPNYSDSGRIWGSDFYLPVKIEATLTHKTSGQTKTIQCVVNTGGKAHTYNSYPDNHPKNGYSFNGEALFNVESGLLQTGIAYPRSANTGFESQVATGNMDGSSIEFVGRGLDFNPGDYKLERIIVLK